jgi:hypothetical protein
MIVATPSSEKALPENMIAAGKRSNSNFFIKTPVISHASPLVIQPCLLYTGIPAICELSVPGISRSQRLIQAENEKIRGTTTIQ